MDKRGKIWLWQSVAMLFCVLFAVGTALAEDDGAALAGGVVATVTVDGQTTEFSSLDTAWDYAQGKTATIRLLQSVDASTLTPSGQHNNKDNISVLCMEAGNITLEMEDGVELYTDKNEYQHSSIIQVYAGTFTLESGTLRHGSVDVSTMLVSGGTVNITNGTVRSGYVAMGISGECVVRMSGGIFEGNYAAIKCEGEISVGSLLEYGYAYWKGNESGGNWVSEAEMNGSILQSGIEVKPAPVEITAQPTDQTITYGDDVTLRISAQNAVGYEGKPISLAWYRVKEDGDEETGTEESCTYSNLQAGSYTFYCAVTCDGVRIKSRTVTVTAEPKSLKPVLSGTGSVKIYDGTDEANAAALGLSLDLEGIINQDDVTAAASSYTYNSANVGEATTITANGITLGGDDKDNYKLSSDSAGMPGSIQKAAGSLTVSGTDFTKKFGDPDFSLSFSSVGDGAVSCVSGNEEVAVVSADGEVTIQGAGKAEITISLAEGKNYTGAAGQTVTVTVEKADAPVLEPETRNYSCAAGSNGAVAIRVAEMLPKDRGTTGYTVAVRDTDQILSGVSVDSDGTLSYTAEGNRAAGSTACVEVSAEMQNYEKAVFAIDINLVDKKEVVMQPGGSVSLKEEQTPTEGQRLSELEFAPVVFVEKGTDQPVEGELAWRRPSELLREGEMTAEWIFTPADSGKYLEQIGTVTFTVAKKPEKEDAPNMPSQAITVPHRCKKVEDVELPPDWEWREEDRERDLVVGESVEATAVYTGKDIEDYKNVKVVVTITRTECEHTQRERKNEIPAGCETEGYTGDIYCKECGVRLESGTKIAAVGHDWQETVIREPDFDTEGRRLLTCSRCGSSYEEPIPKLPKPQESESSSEAPTETPEAPTETSEAPTTPPEAPSETPAQTMPQTQAPKNTKSPDTGETPEPVLTGAAVLMGFGIFVLTRSRKKNEIK